MGGLQWKVSMSEFDVRIATPEDRIKLLELSQAFFNESHYAKTSTFDSLVTLNTIDSYFERRKEEAIIFVLTHKGTIVGMISGLAIPSFFNRDYTAVEHIWYVLPEFRGRHSLSLLKALMAWSKHVGCKTLVATGQTQDETNLRGLYTRFGFIEKEYTFIKEL